MVTKIRITPGGYMRIFTVVLKGFLIGSTFSEELHKGDVLVFGSIGDHIHGHIEVFTGNADHQFASDFKQKGPYPWAPWGSIDVYRYG